MHITIIGSGNTATVLGRLFKDNGHTIIEIISRDLSHASQLAGELNAVAGDDVAAINKESDVYIIAVNDDAIEEVSSNIFLGEKLVVHTCGSVSINVLEKVTKNFGVLYPLQSLRKETNYSPSIPFLIDGNNTYSKKDISNLAASVSSEIKQANDEERLQYHLSAVVVSNFTNHLFVLTKDYCKANDIDFYLLLPLIKEMVNRLQCYEPFAMQTGPAVRGNEATMQKHLQLLNEFPPLKKIYKLMSDSISNFSLKKR